MGANALAWVESDPMLRARAAYDLGFRSGLLDDVADGLLDDKLVVLRGARRVGKSVLLKDTAARLCGRGDVDPRQLVYVPTDGMRASDLSRVAKLGRELTRSVGEATRVWLLDEVTGLRGWTQALKYLRDNTELGADTVVCTGSSWDREAEVERDLLTGRAGTSASRRSRILHPMSFRDVLAATGREVPLPVRLSPWALQDEAARDVAESLELFVDELDLAWQSYLTSGGFPRAVAEHHKTGEVSEAFLRDLAAWLHRDVDPEAGEDSVPKLLSAIEGRCASPLNRRALAEDLGYGSRQTADLRLMRLVSTYAAIWCHQVDEDGRRVAGAQSKLYLCDPLLAWLGSRLRAGLPHPDFSRLTEARLGVTLARAVDDLRARAMGKRRLHRVPAHGRRQGDRLRPGCGAEPLGGGTHRADRVEVGVLRMACRGEGDREQVLCRRGCHADGPRFLTPCVGLAGAGPHPAARVGAGGPGCPTAP